MWACHSSVAYARAVQRDEEVFFKQALAEDTGYMMAI
jgi:hypothetical protein